MPKGTSAKANKAPIPAPVRIIYSRKNAEGLRKVSLIKLGGLNVFTPEQLRKIKDNKNYSFQNIDALFQYSRRLITYPYDLSSEQMLKIASFKGADVTIKKIYSSFEKLREFGFTVTKIVNMASHDEGWNNIQKTLEKFIPKPEVEREVVDTALGDTQAQTLVVAEAPKRSKIAPKTPKRSKIVAEPPKDPEPLMDFEPEEVDTIEGLDFMAYDSPSELLLLAPFPMSPYQFYMQ